MGMGLREYSCRGARETKKQRGGSQSPTAKARAIDANRLADLRGGADLGITIESPKSLFRDGYQHNGCLV